MRSKPAAQYAEVCPAPMADWLKDAGGRQLDAGVEYDCYQYLNRRYRSESTPAKYTSVGKRYPFRRQQVKAIVGTWRIPRVLSRLGNGRQLFFDRLLPVRQRQQRRLYQLGGVDGRSLRCHVSFLKPDGYLATNPPQLSLPEIRTSRRSCSKLEPTLWIPALAVQLPVWHQNMEYRQRPIVARPAFPLGPLKQRRSYQA